MLGTAIKAVFFSKSMENSETFPSVGIADSLFFITNRDRIQLTPWQRKVAQATPDTSI